MAPEVVGLALDRQCSQDTYLFPSDGEHEHCGCGLLPQCWTKTVLKGKTTYGSNPFATATFLVSFREHL